MIFCDHWSKKDEKVSGVSQLIYEKPVTQIFNRATFLQDFYSKVPFQL
jgi:hypothetical protein